MFLSIETTLSFYLQIIHLVVLIVNFVLLCTNIVFIHSLSFIAIENKARKIISMHIRCY